jgi:hypothetical protein
VTLSGPLFDGTAAQVMSDGAAAARHKLAAVAADRAQGLLSASIRRSRSGAALHSVTTTDASRTYATGKYQLPVAAGAGETVVTSDLATYGPWLEGTGSRNQSTRFKGYQSFRMAAQQLDGEAQGLADQALAPYVARIS